MTQHRGVNDLSITLDGAITAGATSITVAGTTTVLASNVPVYLTIESEILECTSVASQVLTVVRGVQSTTAASHADLTDVFANITAANQNELIDEKVDSSILTTKGDLFGRNSSEIGRIPVGSDGQVLTADSAKPIGVGWETPSSGGGSDPSTSLIMVEDWVTGTEDTDELGSFGWRFTKSGTGSSVVRVEAESGHPGIMRLVNGNSNTSRTSIYIGESGMNTVFPSGGEIVFENVIRFDYSSISDVSNIYVGLLDETSVRGAEDNGIFFELGATNWFISSSSSSTKTSVDTGIAIVDNAWVKLRFTLNAAASSIQANIDGSDAGTAITTNIPTVALSPVVRVDGISGGSSTNTDWDYMKLTQSFSSER